MTMMTMMFKTKVFLSFVMIATISISINANVYHGVQADAAEEGQGQGDDRVLRQLKKGKQSKSSKKSKKSSTYCPTNAPKCSTIAPEGSSGSNTNGDPNVIKAKHSYDFTFADGTRVSGVSESNIIEVTVDGRVFNLDISCVDTFDDGYGSEEGPVEGVNPRVVKWKIWKYINAGTEDCCFDEVCFDTYIR
jgi:hypothetical protein